MKFFPFTDATFDNAGAIFRKKIVIFSSPSQGSVGQLSLDIILSALHCSSRLVREGSIESFDLLPCTGIEQLCSTSAEFIVMPLEVYSLKDSPFVFIQQRAMCIKGKIHAFSKSLTDMLTSFDIERLVILCGAEPADAFEASIKESRIFSVFRESTRDELLFAAEYPKFQELLVSTRVVGSSPFSSSSIWGAMTGLPLAKSIAEAEMSFPVCLIGKFCSDGNNANDGIDLAAAVSVALGVLVEEYFLDFNKVNRPSSWSKLFGAELYSSREICSGIYY